MKADVQICLKCQWAKRGVLTDEFGKRSKPLMCLVPRSLGPSLIEYPNFEVPEYQCPYVLEHAVKE